MKTYRFIISGGGTGGHIFPGIAIANELKRRYPHCEILFVGANGKMEMQKIPDAGYSIKGLDIQGLQRKLTFDNLLFPYKVWRSIQEAKKIIKAFDPDAVIGVGGYASAPTLRAATILGIPTLIQEQNNYAGLTNKWLSKKVKTICVAYPNMERFFPKDKIVFTGNPVRDIIAHSQIGREQGMKAFGLDSSKKTVLAIGGSLGARTINRAIEDLVPYFINSDVQLIWQTGEIYYKQVFDKIVKNDSIVMKDFIRNMEAAYACADLVISRAGAISVSELCIVGKPTILIPSPNVAEDHQTKNAMALVNENAAKIIKDEDAQSKLKDVIDEILLDENIQNTLSKNIKKFEAKDAVVKIVDEIERIIK